MQDAAACTLSKELTEGPYWIDTNLTRRDITENRNGVPLTIVFTVRDVTTCDVVKCADVEIWHADAGGVFSGFSSGGAGASETARAAATPQNSRRFLRGHQKTNSSGKARFETIFPGWYRGRSSHIHLKVHVGGNEVHTGQLFFKQKFSRAVYATRYYEARGQAETSNGEDSIYDSSSVLALTKRSSAKSYLGRITLNIDRGSASLSRP